MGQRIFLGWDRPFVGLLAEWLLSEGEDLSTTLVVVPSVQSGRQLRHQLASRAGALFSPQIRTPGSLMSLDNSLTAPNWLERMAWQEILEREARSEWLEAIFGGPSELNGEWAGGLAAELLQLRRSLQENALSLRDTSHRLGNSPEGARWRALAALESRVEAWLRQNGHQSRSAAIAQGITLPDGAQKLVLAGITEMPPVLERTLMGSGLELKVLVAAPESEADHFSASGIPLSSWNEREIPWPTDHGGVHVTSDPGQQARLARQLVASARTPVTELALGTADAESGDVLAREFSAAGWTSHHPASPVPETGLRRWWAAWRMWLIDPHLRAAAQLLALPETGALMDGDRAAVATALTALRDQWMTQRPEDIRHRLREGKRTRLRKEAFEVITAVEKLEHWRTLCLGQDINGALRHLLDALTQDDTERAREYRDWLQQASAQLKESARPAAWWIELMLDDIAAPPLPPPADRLLDVQGWLELLYEPGSHLVLCSVNEGRLPACQSGDPWLGESARSILGLRTDADRAARDAYLLLAITRARLESGGRVDLICCRTNQRGEPMMPSRLLLAGGAEQLPGRIGILFQDLEPPDAKLRWQADAKWQAPRQQAGGHLNATSFRDYLACPFRYQLKHVVGMQGCEPGRVEWNARDFGNVMHQVLECWGRDPVARLSDQADQIHEWLCRQLEQEVEAAFGERIPLAVRIQLESLRQRLQWFSQNQALHREAGWEIVEVEHKFEIPIADAVVRAKIDRIDRHSESGHLRVIDYKTGGDKAVAAAHRSLWRSNSSLPQHIAENDPVLYSRDDDKGKSQTLRWIDLQLPLYAIAIQARDKLVPTPCYFKLGETRDEVSLQAWEDFDEIDLAAARSCAEWVARRIAGGHFWPPADKPVFDDYDLLWCGRPPGEVLTAP